MDAFGEQQIVGDNSVNKYTMVTVPKYQRNTANQISVRSIFKMNTFCVMVVLSIVLISIASCQSAALPPDSTSETPADSIKMMCHAKTPCGWAVYVPETRRVDYFMKNTCTCPADKACLRTDDDLSISAYVYRCGEKTTTNQEEEYTNLN